MKYPGFTKKLNERDFSSFSLAGKTTDGAYLQKRDEASDSLTIYFRDGSFLQVKADGNSLVVNSEVLEDSKQLGHHYGATFIRLDHMGDEE